MAANGNTPVFERLIRQLEQDPGLPVQNPTQSYWQLPPTRPITDIQSATLPTHADVIIIGSGITACSIARQLLQNDPDICVVILEAQTICSGATGRNGGHIKAVPEVSYAELVPMIGKQKAQEVVDFTLANVEALFEVNKSLPVELQDRSEVRRVESLNLFTDEEGLSRAAEAIESFGNDIPKLKGRMRLLTKAELAEKYGIRNVSGGASSSAGAAWPYRLITGILSGLLETYLKRLNIEAQTPALAIKYSKEHDLYSVETPRGPIKSKYVVHATNGHAGHLLPGIRGNLFPMRGQMTAQSPTKAFGVQGGERSWSVHYDKGFDYITQSGKSGEIFAGGGLVLSDIFEELGNPRDDQNAETPVKHLETILGVAVGEPVRKDTKAIWSGVMGFTCDGLPLVGRLPKGVTGRDGENEWISAGYNGYGMPNAWLCGKHIADMLLQSQNSQSIPTAYNITEARLTGMKVEDAASHWLELFADSSERKPRSVS